MINLFRDYSLLLPEDTYKANYGEELKMSTPKQMLQILTIALAQVKEGNNSKKLLNEIMKIAYSLYQSKEISNIIKSLQL